MVVGDDFFFGGLYVGFECYYCVYGFVMVRVG